MCQQILTIPRSLSMKTMTKNLLMIGSLAVFASNVFADFRDHEMGQRYRERHKTMDICAEIKEDLVEAEDAYIQYAQRIETANNRISVQRQDIRRRKETLNRKQNSFNRANDQVASLTQSKQDKPQLLVQYQATIQAASNAIPSLQITYDAAYAHRKDKCDWRGSLSKTCRRAKRAEGRALDGLNMLKNQKSSAEDAIDVLNNVEVELAKVQRILESASAALENEQAIRPSISKMESSLSLAIARRDENHGNYDEVEARYGRLEVRAEKCTNMQYQARKAQTFRASLLAFAADNGDGCRDYREILRSTRGPAKRDGVEDAYNLVCESDILTRTVTVNSNQADY